jgi:hypothetical protein
MSPSLGLFLGAAQLSEFSRVKLCILTELNFFKYSLYILHKKELHNLYSSPNTIRMMKSRTIRWAGHVARRGRRGIHVGYWWESQKERDH